MVQYAMSCHLDEAKLEGCLGGGKRVVVKIGAREGGERALGPSLLHASERGFLPFLYIFSEF